jgi:hypothetical protein
MSHRRRPRNRGWVALFGMLLAALACAVPALAETTPEAAPTPHWLLEAHTAPTTLPIGGEGVLIVDAANIGDAEVNGNASKVRLLDTLPADVERVINHEIRAFGTIRYSKGATKQHQQELEQDLECPKSTIGPTERVIECTFAGYLAPYEQLELILDVKTSGNAGQEHSEVSVENGGASPEAIGAPVNVGDAPTTFGVESYKLTPENERFEADTEAGSHPFQLTTAFNLDETTRLYPGNSYLMPSAPALERNLHFKLPPGLIGNANVLGNPNAVQQCSGLDFGVHAEQDVNACPEDTAVGVASVEFYDPITLGYDTEVVPVFNLVPGNGEPARFGFEVANVPVVLDTSLRTGDDYGVTVSVENASQAVQVLASRVTFWGVPEDRRHDDARGWGCIGDGSYPELIPKVVPRCANPALATPAPFLTLPTECTTLDSPVEGEAWNTERLTAANGSAEVENEEPTVLGGCAGLPFDPSLSVTPEQTSASTPTNMNVEVSVPQQTTLEAGAKAEADVKATKLVLPEGLQASPGAANGLTACPAENKEVNGQPIGFGFNSPEDPNFTVGAAESTQVENDDFSALAATCLESSKIGTVSIRTPLLEGELTGAVYLAEQDTSPFSSPLALYIFAEEPKSKVLVKLAGEVQINPSTGQLTSVFKNTPETPFETFKLHLENTERASQATPAHCGSYTAHATFEGTSETVERESSFQIASGPNGTACPGEVLPFEPTVRAGSSNLQAGAFTPFGVTIGRPDGNQALERIDLELPQGVAALIANVEQCKSPQAVPLETTTEPCPPGSQIGTTTVLSGLGGAPVTLHGKVYLTEGYGGAPFGLLAVTNATEVGPFDIGYVNVRSQIFVNKETAAVTVISEAIPKMLKGVPAQVKELNVTVERPGNEPFEFNPTSCERLKIGGNVTGYEAGSSGVSLPFQVSNCSSLPFKPALTATVLGHGSKTDGTAFKVTLESPGLGQANIHKVDLTLPEVLPSRLTTIQKACLAAVFEANPAACDEGSDIGEGIVYTPVLKNPLRGPAYLVSHGNAAFPDVEFVLQGEGITLIVDGKTDIKKGITYSKFETAPDAPFTKFETILPAGPHSALTTNVPETEAFSLCKQPAGRLQMPTTIVGQNGTTIEETTKIARIGCGGVLASKVKKLSRAQHLTKALKACKSRYRKNRSKRLACERQARKKYGPRPKKKTSKRK